MLTHHVPQAQNRGENPSEFKDLTIFALLAVTYHLYRGLSYGSLATNMLTTFAPANLTELHTCNYSLSNSSDGTVPEILESTFWDDYGLRSFNLGVLIGLLPLPYLATKKIIQQYRDIPPVVNKLEEILGKIDYEVLHTLFPPIFIIQVVNLLSDMMGFSTALRYGLYSVAAIPTFVQVSRFGLKKWYPDYPEIPSIPSLRGAFKDKSKLVLLFTIVIEAFERGLMSSSAAYSWVWMIIDLFYDGRHKKDYSHSSDVMLSVAGIVWVLSMASLIHDSSYKATEYGSNTLSVHFLIAMSLISELMCLHSAYMDVDAYKKSGVYASGGIFSGALLIAAVAVWMNQKYQNKTQLVEMINPVADITDHEKSLGDIQNVEPVYGSLTSSDSICESESHEEFEQEPILNDPVNDAVIPIDEEHEEKNVTEILAAESLPLNASNTSVYGSHAIFSVPVMIQQPANDEIIEIESPKQGVSPKTGSGHES